MPSGDVYKKISGSYVKVGNIQGASGSTTFGDTEVSILSPIDGQVLTYSSALSGWTNSMPATSSGGGGGSSYANPIDAPPGSPSAYDDEFDGSTLDSKWTVVNATPADTLRSATLDGNGCVVFSSPYTTGDRGFLITQTAPSGAFTMTAKLELDCQLNPYAGGAIWLQGANGNYVQFMGLINGGGQQLLLDRDRLSSSFGRYDGASWAYAVADAGYYRLQYDGTNVIYSYSQSGRFTAASVLATETLSAAGIDTITNIGVGIMPYGTFTQVVCEWFRITQP